MSSASLKLETKADALRPLLDSDHNETLSDLHNDTSSLVANEKLPPPYTIFDSWRHYVLMVLLSITGIWSAVLNAIYFPALPTLTREFGVSLEAMNLTVVAYLAFQGITPIFTSNFADTYGRRPMVLLAFLVYIGSSIGLAVCDAYWLLVFLRCVQAAGIAQVIAINSGIAGDVCIPQNRGGFVGVVSGMLLVGQAFGAIIGSGLISTWNWRAVFVFLAIGAGVTLLFNFVLLTETCRSIVGNGSIKPKNPIHAAPALFLPGYKQYLNNDTSTLGPRVPLDFLAPWRILMNPTVLAVLLPSGLQYTSWTMCLTSLSTALEKEPYNYTVMRVGLMYLPQGICSLAASMISGKMLNDYYSWRRKKYEETYASYAKESRPPFNKIRVRLDVAIFPMFMTLLGLLLFGWVLDKQGSVVGVVIGLCFASLGSAGFIAVVTTMLVDLYPARGLTSTSCINFVRCILAAAFVAALDQMERSMGIGGVYTLMAALCLASNVLLVVVVVQYLKKLKKGNL